MQLCLEFFQVVALSKLDLEGIVGNPNAQLMKGNRPGVAGTRSRIAAIRRWSVDMNCSSERDIWSLVGTPVL